MALFQGALCTMLLVCVLVASGLASPLLTHPAAGEIEIQYGEASSTAYDTDLHSVIQLIPPDGSVLTTGHVFPEVSDRRDAYVLVNGGFILGDSSYATALNRWVNQSNYVLIDYAVDPRDSVIIRNLSNLSSFGLFAAEDGAYLYERGWENRPPAYFDAWSTAMAGGTLHPTANNSISRQVVSSLGPSLYHPAGGKPNDQLWLGRPSVHVPPGRYQVTFSFEIYSPTKNTSVVFKVVEDPAKIVDKTFASNSLGSHHRIKIVRTLTHVTLGSSSYALYSPYLIEASASITFNWNGTGFLNFPGYEMSNQMSMYLLSITLVQLSPLK